MWVGNDCCGFQEAPQATCYRPCSTTLFFTYWATFGSLFDFSKPVSSSVKWEQYLDFIRLLGTVR